MKQTSIEKITGRTLWVLWIASVGTAIVAEQTHAPVEASTAISGAGIVLGMLLVVFMGVTRTYIPNNVIMLIAVVIPLFLIHWNYLVPQPPGLFSLPGLLGVLVLVAIVFALVVGAERSK